MGSNISFGRWGEDKASDYLARKGYTILARNYRCHYGEIDIIGLKNQEISFVEVKSRKSLTYGRPIEAVTRIKQQHIKITAHYFLCDYDSYFAKIHFDVIEILVTGNKFIINHCQDCFDY
ncbi:MAG TPA: YraN family protein [Candidatus Avacidaminococcus intestinavium]|uniref:UPF0102 protein IAB06_00470 n=1 Tax=Candidatus Avacidaminococcus intestinavium TaxID=2840684 RepID=A0A9D1SL12_9FIRM|nr:YraN family protein [Candidatus Avacidaminococcus intestinavium]